MWMSLLLIPKQVYASTKYQMSVTEAGMWPQRRGRIGSSYSSVDYWSTSYYNDAPTQDSCAHVIFNWKHITEILANNVPGIRIIPPPFFYSPTEGCLS